jgi:hypothetical protein
MTYFLNIVRLSAGLVIVALLFLTGPAAAFQQDSFPRPQPSILRGGSAAQQLALVTTKLGFDPQEFAAFIFRAENRYYLETGTAFARCGEIMSGLAGLSQQGRSNASLWTGLERRFTNAGIVDLKEVEWRQGNWAADQNIVSLGETAGLVEFAYRVGQERFRQSRVLQYLVAYSRMLRDMLRFGADSEQIWRMAEIQHANMLSTFTGTYCGMIPTQPDPVPTGCGRPLEIVDVREVNQTWAEVTLSDASTWKIRQSDDLDLLDWIKGDAVRVCSGYLLHVSTSTAAIGTRVKK